MAKFCIKCGAQLEDGEFCKVCGTAVTPQQPEAPSAAQPQAPEPPAQPQYPQQPAQQQYGSQQPQQPYATPQAPGQPYQQPSAPAKKKNKKMLIILIIAGAAAVIIALIITGVFPIGGEPDKNTDEAPVVETAEEDTTGEEPVVETTEADVTEEEEDEEDNTVPDEPPFLTTLRTGVYGYDMYMYATKNDRVIDGDSYVYSNGSLMAICVVESDGEVSNRYIYNYETHMLHWIFDDLKMYAVKEDSDLWYKFGIPDFRAGLEQSGKGTTEFEGETLDYIDCVDCYLDEEYTVRVLIKDGDVYAFQHNNNNWAHTLYLTKTYSSPPTTEYFELPDDYEKSGDTEGTGEEDTGGRAF